MTADRPLTPAQRKAAQRQRQRNNGLVQLELWAPREHHAQIKAFATALQIESGQVELVVDVDEAAYRRWVSAKKPKPATSA